MKFNCVFGKFNLIVLVIGIFIISVFFSFKKANSTELVDRIVAVVNDDIVTLYELNLTLTPYVKQIRTFGYSNEKEENLLYTVREKVLNQLVEEMLTDQEMKNYDISVSETEFNETVERIKKINQYTDEDLRQALEADGLTMEEYYESMKKQILRSKVIEYEVKSKVVVTQEDIRSYYEEHIDEYGGKEKYHLLNILLKGTFFDDQQSKDDVFNAIKMIHDKLNEGQSFEDMSRMYSESPFAEEGGDIGLFSIEELSEQIQDALRKIKVGEFTEILDTDQGYQILFVKEIVKTPGKAFEDVYSEIEDKLYSDKVDDRFQVWLENIRKRSHIKIIR